MPQWGTEVTVIEKKVVRIYLYRNQREQVYPMCEECWQGYDPHQRLRLSQERIAAPGSRCSICLLPQDDQIWTRMGAKVTLKKRTISVDGVEWIKAAYQDFEGSGTYALYDLRGYTLFQQVRALPTTAECPECGITGVAVYTCKDCKVREQPSLSCPHCEGRGYYLAKCDKCQEGGVTPPNLATAETVDLHEKGRS